MATNEAVLKQIIANQSALMARRQLASAVGQMYGDFGKRDVYAAAGYPQKIGFANYNAKYRRQGLASRLIEIFPNETWRLPPTLKDGDEVDTPFLLAWKDLIDFDVPVDEINDRKSIWHYFERADIQSGIGEYGLLLIGVRDGKKLSEPLEKGEGRTSKDLLYLSIFNEGDIPARPALCTDPQSFRYGMPEFYTVMMGDGLPSEKVHWTRVIHISDGLENNELYGRPRLENVYNALEDLLKVTAATGEGAWHSLKKGMVLSTKDGYELNPDGKADREEQFDDYLNQLRRTIELEGMDVHFEGGEIIDPTGVFDSYYTAASVATGIPKRILMGSERGELASTQDTRAWLDKIAARQFVFASPIILRPFINRLMFVGILPYPASGNYQVKWPSLYTLDEVQQTDALQNTADAYGRLTEAIGEPVATREEIRVDVLGLPEEPMRGEYSEVAIAVNSEDGALSNLILNHSEGQPFDRSCPLCTNFGVRQFPDHNGLCLCGACGQTFDPQVE